ncbi:hypothetical protein [Chitinivorax sp. B]|uniref:hypothetical protein n=1 Tax=Chitinivorax sp. B TaxID=2502235 RepID=UPI0010F4F557|nr:hypothetical protein [Chitinivorax sp. B]
MTTEFLRTKPHVNIALIGQNIVDRHALRQNMVDVAGKRLCKTSKSETRRLGNPALAELETQHRHYAINESPGEGPGMIATLCGTDIAVLLVSTLDDIEYNRQPILTLRQLGVRHLMILMGQCESDINVKQADNLERVIRKQLTDYEYPGDTLPIIRSNQQVLETDILHLLAYCDEIPPPERDLTGSLKMPIQHVTGGTGGNVAISGCIVRGTVAEGSIVELLGFQGMRQGYCTAVGTFDKVLTEGQAGDQATVFLSGLSLADVYPGQVLAPLGNLSCCNRLMADVYLPMPEEGGNGLGLITGDRLTFCIGNSEVEGTLELPPEWQTAVPGSTIELTIALAAPTVMDRGEGIFGYDGSALMLAGNVARLLN